MISIPEPRQLLADPVGHCYVARSLVVWVQSTSLLGAFHLGTFDPFDRVAVACLFDLPASPRLAQRYDLLHDLSTLDLLEERAFEFFEMFLARSASAIATRVRRLAVVLPSGYAGAVLEGLATRWVVPLFREFRICDRREQAYRLFDLAPEPEVEVDALYRVHELPPMLVRLRALLVTDPGNSTLDGCAESLAVSPRTLQRCLGARRTSFRRELALARVRAAGDLLLAGGKVEVVARQVGFATGEAFAVSFRNHTGESPRGYRESMLRRTLP